MIGLDRISSGISKFDGTDFSFWRLQIIDYLYSKKLRLPLSKVKPADMSQEDWELLDRQVLGVIRLTLTRNVAHNVAETKSTTEMMRLLSDMYEKPSANNKVHLMKKLFNLRMGDNASVAEHINEFNTIVTQLMSVDITFDDEVHALILLASLPNNWEPMRAAVSNSVGKGKLSFSDVRDRILAEEVRRIDSGEGTSTSSALNVENRGRSKERNSNRGRGRSKSRNGRSKSRNGWKLECWNCGKPGHVKAKCGLPKKEDNKKATNVVADEVQDVLLLSIDCSIESWILDSGASFHTTSNREIMENYSIGNYGKVYLADGEPLEIVGIGDVRLKLENGTVWKINQVRHVHKLTKNLISVGQLDEAGHNVHFTNGSWKVSKGAIVVARGNKTGTLYMTTNCKDTLEAIDAGVNSSLWHCRLGHMSEKGMKLMLSKGKLPDLKGVEHCICESCIFGKQKKVSFLNGGRKPRETKLELVHTDVWGPSPVPSLGGNGKL
ncbi:retrovirus-related Pol polyprotein from transposon TNT 1-94 isoform X2 [Euphorbia lathyris]|uniref:retrovirus-related Pol polyprotein from transposon TNT 1-94 isoform X2 n=1 Tax=Euphorbia lathyris TaxID=212925 RepID=UPI003313D906